MTREEARELLQTTPIDIRSPRDDLSPADYFKALNMAIEALQERPKGRWIEEYKRYIDPLTGECEEEVFFKCPICGRYEFEKEPFCNCGADMRESMRESE